MKFKYVFLTNMIKKKNEYLENNKKKLNLMKQNLETYVIQSEFSYLLLKTAFNYIYYLICLIRRYYTGDTGLLGHTV